MKIKFAGGEMDLRDENPDLSRTLLDQVLSED
jgi:hypothetical protein